MSLASDILQRVRIGAQEIGTSIDQGVGGAAEFVRKNPVTSGVSVAGGVLASGTIVQIARKKRAAARKSKASPKKTTSRKKKSKRKSVRKKRSSKQRKPRTAGKGKDTSTRRIRFTKNNQPYVLMKSGKARFIKKSSVARMRKRKGGKY